MNFLVIPLLSILARASGGGLFANLVFPFLPEMMFGFVLNLALLKGGHWIMYIIASLVSYGWMETGHGTAYMMGKDPSLAQSGRKETLSPLVNSICLLFKKPLGGAFYCWIFMGIKGFLIGFTLPVYGALLAVLWPLSYYIGNRIFNRNDVAEYLSGLSAGLVCCWSLA